jgi:hypothetical protein
MDHAALAFALPFGHFAIAGPLFSDTFDPLTVFVSRILALGCLAAGRFVGTFIDDPGLSRTRACCCLLSACADRYAYTHDTTDYISGREQSLLQTSISL